MKIVFALVTFSMIELIYAVDGDTQFFDDSPTPTKNASYQYKISSTLKNTIIAACTKTGAATAWFYGEPVLYYACYHVAELSAPTEGWRYAMYGYPSYHQAGKTCVTSAAPNAILATAGGALGGALAYFSIKTFESTLTLLGRLFGK